MITLPVFVDSVFLRICIATTTLSRLQERGACFPAGHSRRQGAAPWVCCAPLEWWLMHHLWSP